MVPHFFTPILEVLYNKCIDSGYYPSNFKVAKVTTIHKKGDENDINNYRPTQWENFLNFQETYIAS